MNKETYEHVRSAFDELGEISDTGLQTIDAENIMEARKQLAWSLRRFGVEYEDGIPTEAAALAPEDGSDDLAVRAYEHRFQMVDKDATVDIPTDAVGVTTDTFGDSVTVHYLVPATEASDDAE